MNPRVSVIVPNHNCESYVCRCIDSLLSQDFDNFEIIIVDDGSNDNSVLTIEEGYGLLCGQTKIFHYEECTVKFTFVGYKEQRGVSFARNTGIELSTGDYLTFVDSDDFVDTDFLKLLYDKMSASDSDVVWCGFKNFNESRIKFEQPAVLQSKVLSKQEYQCMFYKYVDGLGSMCTKLYKANIIRDHNIRLEEGRNKGEDWLFNLEYSRYIRNVSVISDVPYVYCRRIDSSTSKYNSDDISKKLESLKVLIDFKEAEHLTIDEKMFEQKFAGEFSMCFMQLILHEENAEDIIDSFFKNPLMKVALNWKTDSKLSIKYKLFWFLLSKGFVNQAIYIVKKVYKLRN